jgi:hypothetical protein
MTNYDDASWHYGGDFPTDLPDEAGATHIGMFVAWALLSGLASEFFQEELAAELAELRAGSTTPGAFLMAACDGKFTDDALSDEGNAFAAAYFSSDRGGYLDDYIGLVGGDHDSLYHVPDTWTTFAMLKPDLDRRLAAWRAQR